MAGPVEILIVLGVFALIGTYLYIVSTFLRETEQVAPGLRKTAPRQEAAETISIGGHSISAH
jgi:hypothetical protein